MAELRSSKTWELSRLINIRYSRILFLALISVVIIEDFIIYSTPTENKVYYTNLVLIANSSVAAGFAIILLLRQKTKGLHAKTHAAIAIGLCLWLCANIIWTVYENVLDVVPPVPSSADFFWLSAYPFFGYYLYMTYNELHKEFNNKRLLFIILIGAIVFVSYIIPLTINLSVLSSGRGIAMFSVMLAYPILNTILIVPAVTILMNFRKQRKGCVTWVCESLSLLSLIIADSWFAIIFLTHLTEEIWYSNLFLIDHYLITAGGLAWYMIFFNTTNDKQIKYYAIGKKIYYYVQKRIRFIAFVVATTVACSIIVNPIQIETYFHSNSNVEASAAASGKELQIGVLIGLSGISAERGVSQKAALDIAVKDLNENLSKKDKNIRVALVFEDTQRNPDIALEKLKYLAGKGIRLVIGPQTSEELKKVKDYANKNKILLISYSSTATSLAIANDNIFRFVQNDTYQAESIARLMRTDGVQAVVPVYRNDTYGHGLYTDVKNKFENLLKNGTVYDGIGYHPPIGKFAASLHRINFIMWDQDLKVLSSDVNRAIHQYGANKVGVYIVAFDEIVPILIQAQSHANLSKVKWYGSDGSAKNERLLKNNEAAEFAYKTTFPNPIAKR
jgi:ABC-type branched-subunit amino acid transport system substrate-binding protein